MGSKNVFDLIKKQNGEKFAKTIRNYDNGIFDVPNIAGIVKFAGREAEPIMNYLVSLKNIRIEDVVQPSSPFELLHRAGYHAEYADTLDKQNSIKKYFRNDERLCTFGDDNRYRNYYIMNAVRYDVSDIKRENFKNPSREDEYGTSVISIQMLKKGGFISIKNRYNHTVENPDNTFGSNPDNIIYGLSAALKAHFKVNFSSQETILPDGYVLIDNHVLQYNYELNNIYFGEFFCARDGVVHELNSNIELMMDYFIFDQKAKSIANPARVSDSFADVFETEISRQRIRIENINGCKRIVANGALVLTLDQGRITDMNIMHTKKIGENFLKFASNIKTINIHAGIEYVGDVFLNSYRGVINRDPQPVVNIACGVHGKTLSHVARKTKWGLPLLDEEEVIGDHVIRDADGVEWIHNGPGFYNNKNIEITIIINGVEIIQKVNTGTGDWSASAIEKMEGMFSAKYSIPVKIYGFLCTGVDEERGWYYRADAPKYSRSGAGLVYKTRIALGKHKLIDDSALVFFSRYGSAADRGLFGADSVGLRMDVYSYNRGAAFAALDSCVKRYMAHTQNQKT